MTRKLCELCLFTLQKCYKHVLNAPNFVFKTPCNVPLSRRFTSQYLLNTPARFMVQICPKFTGFTPQMHPFYVFNEPVMCLLRALLRLSSTRPVMYLLRAVLSCKYIRNSRVLLRKCICTPVLLCKYSLDTSVLWCKYA